MPRKPAQDHLSVIGSDKEHHMPVSWKPSTPEAHRAIPKKKAGQRDPEWETLLDELERGNTVMIEYGDEKERGTLSRSLGRRASHRGFKVDLRDGGGYLSVEKAEAVAAAPRRGRPPKQNVG
jgi:hypothetical protein